MNLFKTKKVDDVKTDIAFISILMSVENAPRVGRDSKGLWFPHPSPEGGTDTLGYGHKLTPAEVSSGVITIANGARFLWRAGLSDAEIFAIFQDDLNKAADKAEAQWNRFYGETKPFEKLPRNYQHILTNLVFNVGTIAGANRFGWPSLARAMINGDGQGVRKEMVTTYLKPSGERVRLEKRAKQLADALSI